MQPKPYTIRRFILTGLVAIISLTMPDWAAAGDLPGVTRAIGVQVHHSPALMKRPGVVGTAVGLTALGAPAITIYTEKLGIGGLPKSIDGIEVVVKVTGKILPLHHCKGAHASDPACAAPGEDAVVSVVDPAVRFARPVPIGVSAGNVKSITTDGFFISCSAGTLGARLTDGRSSLGFGLSNNHVFALSNQSNLFTESIVQPGPADADPVCSDYANADIIGFLEDYEPIEFSIEATNQMDAAIAREPSVELIGKSTPPDGYGMPKSHTLNCQQTQPECGNLLMEAVQKYGRTTGLTKGMVTGVNVILYVAYEEGTARFVDQLEVSGGKGGFIKSGDSGSLLVTDPGRQPVGLLFAGDRGGKTGFANRIDLVLKRFEMTIDGE